MGQKCALVCSGYCSRMYGAEFWDFEEEIEIYIDDIESSSGNWGTHLPLLHNVCSRLKENDCTVNPTKYERGVKETNWLGYWLTPVRLKPWKNIEAVTKVGLPKIINGWEVSLELQSITETYSQREHVVYVGIQYFYPVISRFRKLVRFYVHIVSTMFSTYT